MKKLFAIFLAIILVCSCSKTEDTNECPLFNTSWTYSFIFTRYEYNGSTLQYDYSKPTGTYSGYHTYIFSSDYTYKLVKHDFNGSNTFFGTFKLVSDNTYELTMSSGGTKTATVTGNVMTIRGQSNVYRKD